MLRANGQQQDSTAPSASAEVGHEGEDEEDDSIDAYARRLADEADINQRRDDAPANHGADEDGDDDGDVGVSMQEVLKMFGVEGDGMGVEIKVVMPNEATGEGGGGLSDIFAELVSQLVQPKQGSGTGADQVAGRVGEDGQGVGGEEGD